MQCAAGFLHTARRCLPPTWRGILLCDGHSAVLMGLQPGVLWSLDIVPATAYLGAFTGGMFHGIGLIVRQVRVMS